MSALIRFIHGELDGEAHPVRDGAEIMIGRDADCDLVLPGRKVSRQHAELLLEDGELLLTTVSATNAVWVNGAACDGAELRVGDEVRIGEHAFRVERIDKDARRRTVIPELDGLPELEDRTQYHGLMRCVLAIQKLINEDADCLVERSLEMVFLAIPASRLALFLVTPDGHVLQGFTKLNEPLSDKRSRLSHGFAREVLRAGQGILIEDVSQIDPERYGETLGEQEVQSVVGVPVRVGECICAAVVGDNLARPGTLTRDHASILDFVALALAYAFQRDDLQRLRRRQAQTEQQLNAAQHVQQHVCNKPSPERMAGMDWAVAYRPALELGGDFYDWHLDGDRVTWVIADVSGKGVPAALVVSMLRAYCRTLHERDLPPHAFLLALDNLLQGEIPPGMFVTAGVLQADPHHAGWCAAGHPPLIVLPAAGPPRQLPVVSGSLGMSARPLPAADTRTTGLELAPGDRFCMLTDGVIEAVNPQREEFGFDHAIDHLAETRNERLADQIGGLLGAIDAFAAGAGQYDDITLILGRR
ncbi:MAG: SpoIIE family protein phosphatase [Planctomycetota bacterium]